MKILEFAFVAYPATNLEASRSFYEGVLGLRCSTSTINGHEFWIEYDVGAHTLGIGNEPFMKPSPNGAQLVLEVENFEESVAHLKRCKVEFAVEPFAMPNCRAAVIIDPDGNRVGIHKRTRSA
jgi:predicted enzyme related to lactoylglutathione lyase